MAESATLENVTLVLLPGLDGTGNMFHPFLEKLPPELKVEVVKYSPNEMMTYPQLVKYVEEAIAQLGDVVLLGESFSGPIALELLSSDISNIKGAIFCATFIASPRPILLKLANFLPLSFIFRVRLPGFVIRLFCLGLETSGELLLLFRETLTNVPPETIAYRLRLLNKLQSRQWDVNVPCCYIQATGDRLVPRRSLKQLLQLLPKLEVVRIEGPHFILQANPDECAEVVVRFMRSVVRSPEHSV